MTSTYRARLIGREGENRLVERSVADARAGRPQVLVVEGEAGIGKSRLVHEVLDRLGDPEDVVIVGHGVDVVGGELPLGVITGALRDLIRRVGIDTVRSAGTGGLDALNFLVPGLLDESSAPPDRLRVFDAFATLLSRLSHQQLTWFVIEDLHWSDTSSRDLLSYVVRSLDADARLLTACTLRTQDTSPHMTAELFANELGSLPNARTVRLRSLDRAHVSDLLGELSQETPTQAVLDHVVALSSGVPFLVEELVAAGVDDPGRVPESVATTMLRRVANLRPDTRTLVRVASLGGAHLQHHRLAEVCDLDEEKLAAALAEAVRTNILEADAEGTGYRFHHALMRAAVDHSLLPSERATWHQRWAEQLDRERSTDEPLAAIAAAHHWAQTHDDIRAFDAAIQAADLAEAFGAESERAILLTRLLDLWPRVPHAEERAGRERDTVLLGILSAHGGSGSADDLEAAAALLEAELAQADGRDDTRRLWLRLELADCRENQGSEAMETFFGPGSTAVSLVERAPRDRTFVRAVSVLAARSLTEHSEDAMVDLVHEAVSVASDVSVPLEQLLVRRHQVNLLEVLGRHEDALELSAALVRWAGQQRFLSEVSVTESNHAFQLTVVGKFGEAADVARRALTRLDKPALSRWAWTFVVENLARALAEVGQWDAAEEQLRTALDLNIGGEHRVFLEVEAGLIRCHRGDLAGAETYLSSARGRLPEPASAWWTAAFTVRWLAAAIAAAKAEHAAVRAELAPLLRREEAVSLPLGWRVLLLAARNEADLAGAPSSGRQQAADEGRDKMAELLAFGDSLPAVGDLGSAWTAQLAAESRRFVGTAEAADWEAAVEGWHRTGQVHDEAWAMLRLASCQLSSGDKDSAAQVLSSALSIGSRLDAGPLIDAVNEVAGRGRIPLDAPDSSAHMHHKQFGLTQREREVLRLVADGNRNEQIARALFISPKTASVHVSRILAKLGAASRTEAAAVAHREGLLDDA